MGASGRPLSPPPAPPSSPPPVLYHYPSLLPWRSQHCGPGPDSPQYPGRRPRRPHITDKGAEANGSGHVTSVCPALPRREPVSCLEWRAASPSLAGDPGGHHIFSTLRAWDPPAGAEAGPLTRPQQCRQRTTQPDRPGQRLAPPGGPLPGAPRPDPRLPHHLHRAARPPQAPLLCGPCFLLHPLQPALGSRSAKQCRLHVRTHRSGQTRQQSQRHTCPSQLHIHVACGLCTPPGPGRPPGSLTGAATAPRPAELWLEMGAPPGQPTALQAARPWGLQGSQALRVPPDTGRSTGCTFHSSNVANFPRAAVTALPPQHITVGLSPLCPVEPGLDQQGDQCQPPHTPRSPHPVPTWRR